MMGTVHLHHLSKAVFSLPPLTVFLASAMFLPCTLFHEPGACRLAADNDPFALFELLGEKGGAEIGIGFLVQAHNPLFQFEGQSSV